MIVQFACERRPTRSEGGKHLFRFSYGLLETNASPRIFDFLVQSSILEIFQQQKKFFVSKVKPVELVQQQSNDQGYGVI